MGKITIGYPATVAVQKSLPGFKPTKKSDYFIVPEAEGHMFKSGVSLCGVSEKELLSRVEAKKMIYQTYAIQGRPLCKECEDKYKTMLGSPWAKWLGYGTYTPPEGF